MRSKLNISAFPARLKAQRKRKNLTQQELSERTNISVKTINTWETTELKEGSGPKVSNIIALCEALECDFEYLFGGIDFPIRDYVDIHDETGLSEAAIHTLHDIWTCDMVDDPIRSSNLRRVCLQFINNIIKTESLVSLSVFYNNILTEEASKYFIVNEKGSLVDALGETYYVLFIRALNRFIDEGKGGNRRGKHKKNRG